MRGISMWFSGNQGIVGCGLALWLKAGLASAQTGGACTAPATRAVYERASEAYTAGRCATAAAAYEELYRLCPQVEVHLALAKSYECAGRFVEARSSYRHYLDEGATRISGPDRQDAEESLRRVEGQIAVLTVRTTPPNAVIEVDGRPNEGARGLLSLSPGLHSVAVSAEGCTRNRRDVELRGGAREEVVVTLECRAPEAGVTPSRVVRGGPGAAPWILVGAGAAVAIAGGVLAGVSISKGDESQAMCPGLASGCASHDAAVELFGVARLYNGAGWTAVGVGAAAMVGGLVWFFVSRGGENQSASRLQWGVGPTLGGISLSLGGNL